MRIVETVAGEYAPKLGSSDVMNSVEQPPICCRCGASMTLLGILPARSHLPLKRVYRCMTCGDVKVVESE